MTKITPNLRRAGRRPSLKSVLFISLFSLACIACGPATRSVTEVTTPQVVLSPTEPVKAQPEEQTDLELPKCEAAQLKYYSKAIDSLRDYTSVFFTELAKLDQFGGGFQLKIRRSEMTILFGSGLLRRMSMFEVIASCQELWGRYQNDREMLFGQIDRDLKR